MKKLSILTIAAIASNISAATARISDNVSDSVSAINLSEVAVVAQRADAKTPIPFTNITQKDIERINNGVDIPLKRSLVQGCG